MTESSPSKTTRLDPQVIRLAIVLLTGVMAVAFDTTIVNVALDTLGREMNVPVSTIQWVTTGYLLALGMAVPVTGWLVERFGGKPVWMAALSLFLAGSIASSLAWDATSLIAARALQGVGGGIMLPVMQTLLMQAAGGRNLGRMAAVMALPIMLGPILGPVLGGVIVDSLYWRWIFWINVPFCLAGLLLAWRMLPKGEGRSAHRLDIVGLALVSPGVAALIFALAQVAGAGGFAAPAAWAPLGLGLLLISVFVIRSWGRREALVDLTLFRVPSFAAATGLLLLSGFVLYGAMLLIPLYSQRAMGLSAYEAGLLLAPQGVGILLSRAPAGILTDRFGPRWIVLAGLAATIAGTLPFALESVAGNPWILGAALIVRGMGLGAVTIPVMVSAYHGLDKTEMPHASIITRTAQQIGGSFGSAVLAVILETGLSAAGADKTAQLAAYANTFWWTIGFTALAGLIALSLPAEAAGKKEADDGEPAGR